MGVTPVTPQMLDLRMKFCVPASVGPEPSMEQGHPEAGMWVLWRECGLLCTSEEDALHLALKVGTLRAHPGSCQGGRLLLFSLSTVLLPHPAWTLLAYRGGC